MQRRTSRARARNEARKLLEQFGFIQAPLDLIYLLDFLDLEYKGFDPDDLLLDSVDTKEVSAFIEYNTNCLFYNKLHHRNRVRFSVAHEVGHYHLNHRSLPHGNNYSPKDPEEQEANAFASELLMPTYMLKSEQIHSKEDIRRIAEKYGVSVKAAELRVRYDRNILGGGYDYIARRSEGSGVKSLQEIEFNLLSRQFPPHDDFEDDYEAAIDFYSEYKGDDLVELLEWIAKNDLDEDYPEACKAIKWSLSDTDDLGFT